MLTRKQYMPRNTQPLFYNPYQLRYSNTTAICNLELIITREVAEEGQPPLYNTASSPVVDPASIQGVRTIRNINIDISAKFLWNNSKNDRGYTVFPYIYYALIYVPNGTDDKTLMWSPNDGTGYLFVPKQNLILQEIGRAVV